MLGSNGFEHPVNPPEPVALAGLQPLGPAAAEAMTPAALNPAFGSVQAPPPSFRSERSMDWLLLQARQHMQGQV